MSLDMDKYSPQEQETIKRLFLRALGAYSALALTLAVIVTAKTHQLPSRMATLIAPTGAVAAERSGLRRCAARDVKLLMAIEDAGEARTAPAEAVADAFLTMLTARDLCRAGEVDDALAVYDSVAIAPTRSAAK